MNFNERKLAALNAEKEGLKKTLSKESFTRDEVNSLINLFFDKGGIFVFKELENKA